METFFRGQGERWQETGEQGQWMEMTWINVQREGEVKSHSDHEKG